MSDESSGEPEPQKPKRILRPLTETQWRLARVQFETSGKAVNLRKIAEAFDTSLSSVQKRSASEQWSKGQQIVQSVRNEAAMALHESATIEARKAGALAGKRLAEELQPWIEAEKRAHVQRAIKRSKRGMKRLDRVARGYQVYDTKLAKLVNCKTNPKDEMQIAQAEDKYDGIIRRNLGLNDGSALSGALSVNILTQQAAVHVTQD